MRANLRVAFVSDFMTLGFYYVTHTALTFQVRFEFLHFDYSAKPSITFLKVDSCQFQFDSCNRRFVKLKVCEVFCVKFVRSSAT